VYRLTVFVLLVGFGDVALPSHADALRISTIVMPPFIEVTPGDAPHGQAVDAVTELAEACGLEPQVIIMPSWNRAFTSAQTGVTDAVIPANYSAERAEHFDFPDTPLLTVEPRLFVRKDSSFTAFTGFAMLDGHGVSVRKNAILEAGFDAYVRAGTVALFERGESRAMMDDLLSGRVDFVASPPTMFEAALKAHGLMDRVRSLEPALGKSVQYLALSKKRAAVIAEGTPASACLLGE
jgi:ABC-type amino acid transport substrate-binding protein